MTDYTKLIERLRNTPNWQRESYGDWKQGTVHYDRAPFEAAEAIEALQEENALLEGTLESRERNIAEMQAENERLAHANNALKLAVSGLQSQLDAMGKGEPVAYDDKSCADMPPRRVMERAHSFCPTELPHLDRMAWMADYFWRNYAVPKALAPSREVIGRYMADKGFYLGKEALDGLMVKLEGIGGTQ